MEEKDTKNTKKAENSGKSPQNGKVLRCINIDCVLNSSNEQGAVRNTCRHPNVVVESHFADITIAICSEFRSKKDYSFEKPATLIDLKSKEQTEIIGRPDIGATTIEKVTTKDLEEGVAETRRGKTKVIPKKITDEEKPESHVKPVILESAPALPPDLTPSEFYNLSDKPGTGFLVLKSLYQPYTKRGLAVSIVFHLFLLLVMYQTLVPKEETSNGEHNQRIVIVEDLEMPKFDPPDIDKIKEEEKLEEDALKENSKEIRPKITKKNVTPKINRPKDNTEDTSKTALNDTNRVKLDSSLANLTRDTSRIQVPDSLKSTFDQNDVGLKLWYPLGWRLLDNRQVNLNQKEFNGVIIATDSLSEDPGAVNLFILIDDPAHSSYNKATYKNPFLMDDSLAVAYVTDPMKSSGKKFSTKYFLFTDPTGKKNIQVNVDFASQAMMEKYQKLVDAVVRSIKIVEPPTKVPGP